MSNTLISYLNKRFEEEKESIARIAQKPGPVITISREVGCNGLKLAKLLAARLNAEKPKTDWEVLSKEILVASANELNMHIDDVRKTVKQSEKYTFSEILKAFNDKNFKSEQKITKTIIDTILKFATEGYCIIVGRDGHMIAKDIEKSLHIRMVAPLEYRVKNIMQNNQLSRLKAIEFINKVEKERQAFRDSIRPKWMKEELFDITLNLEAFTDEEVLQI
ncbi:MAG: cytidylate kinase-like family protein, partial [Bacteroidetes bacterium]